MAELIELKDAAQSLGISPEELSDLRSQGEIHGYRDGSTWKFKKSELERFASQREVTGETTEPESGGSTIDADLDRLVDVSEFDTLDADSILVSELELGGSEVGTSSTIIGRGDKSSTEDSDIQVASEATEAKSPGSDTRSGKLEVSPEDVEAEGSDAKGSDVLGDEPELVPDDSSASGIRLATGSDVLGAGDASGAVGQQEGDTAAAPVADEPLELDDGLSLGSPEDLDLEGPSALELTAEAEKETPAPALEDDELVLDSGTGSDVTLSGDSGINLSSPIDSGLSLEEPVDLSGPELEAVDLSDPDLQLEEVADPEAATQLKSDDDFLLTPIEGAEGEDTDTGSQVIALDTEDFDETADTMLHQGASPMLAEADLVAEPETDLEAEEMAGPSPLVPQAAVAPESSYSVMSVLSLLTIVVVLGLTGIMMADLVRNIWSWDQPTTFSSKLMDWVLSLFG